MSISTTALDRRSAVKIAAAASLLAAGGACIFLVDAAPAEDEGRAEARRHITKYEKDGEALFVSTSCMHCEEPACASVCPAGAIKKAEDGVVYVDKDRCIGCKYCYQACPFGVPRFPDSGPMTKCDLCGGFIDEGHEAPPCVASCPTRALAFTCLTEEDKRRNEEALPHFRNVEARYPRHHKNADALLRTGMILKQQGDTAGAGKVFRQVVQRFPSSAAADLIRKKGLVRP